jgi:integrase
MLYSRKIDVRVSFGQSRISRVTALEADRFRSWLKGVQNLAESTVRTHIKNAKLIFKAADKGDLIKGNAFSGHKTAVHANTSRMEFVERDTIDKVMKACPDSRWRAIVALCRFGGLRCPSEVLTLKWDEVNFDEGKMTVTAPKTEHHEGGGVRIVPLFPEVRKALEELMLDPNGAEFVISSNDRSFSKNLRTVFLKILKRAKVEPWGKPFQNLRSSRETELSHEYPLHIVVAWLGNSMKTAKKHNLQIRDTDFEKAIGKNDARNDADESGSNRNLPEVEIAKRNEKALNRRKTPQNKAFVKTEQYPGRSRSLSRCDGRKRGKAGRRHTIRHT